MVIGSYNCGYWSLYVVIYGYWWLFGVSEDTVFHRTHEIVHYSVNVFRVANPIHK